MEGSLCMLLPLVGGISGQSVYLIDSNTFLKHLCLHAPIYLKIVTTFMLFHQNKLDFQFENDRKTIIFFTILKKQQI